ncbi:MAG: hypothetical protein ACJ8BW_36580 [Ktedonobacteraceae bacterium]
MQRYYGFLLQQAWDEQLSVQPYVATIQTVLQSLLQLSSPPENHAR